MSSDVGVSRIWNRMLDAAFDNSNRYTTKIKLPADVVNNLFEVFDFCSIPEAKYDRFVLMHLHPLKAFRDAEWRGEENANTTFRIFSFSNYPNITFHKDHNNPAAAETKTILFFIVDGNTEWAFWGK